MIVWADFVAAVLNVLRRDIQRSANRDQHDAINALPPASLSRWRQWLKTGKPFLARRVRCGELSEAAGS